MISSEYRVEEGGWYSREVRDVYGVGRWKEIKKEAAALKELFQFSVGDGRRVCFWKDIWCGSEPLKMAFPNLYNLAVSKGAPVADRWVEGVAGGWNLKFMRPFDDWELDQLYSLLIAL